MMPTPRFSTPSPVRSPTPFSPPPAPRRCGHRVSKQNRSFSVPRTGRFATLNHNTSQPVFNWQDAMELDDEKDDHVMEGQAGYEADHEDCEMDKGGSDQAMGWDSRIGAQGPPHQQHQAAPVSCPAAPPSSPPPFSFQQRPAATAFAHIANSSNDVDMFMGEGDAASLPITHTPVLSWAQPVVSSTPIMLPVSPGFPPARGAAVYPPQYQHRQLQPTANFQARPGENSFGTGSLPNSPAATQSTLLSSSPSFGTSSTIYSSTGPMKSSPIPRCGGVKRARDFISGSDGEELEDRRPAKKVEMGIKNYWDF
ncbi:hypothetical protein HDK77DRAFT_424187 [Phyllosticta capitalensis]